MLPPVLLVLGWFPGVLRILPDICWFHRTTGLPCPGCGMTRSVACLLQGDLHEALRLHPLGPLVLMALVFLTVAALLPDSPRMALVARVESLEARVPWLPYVLLVGLVIFGMVRLALTWTGALAPI